MSIFFDNLSSDVAAVAVAAGFADTDAAEAVDNVGGTHAAVIGIGAVDTAIGDILFCC